MSKSEVKRRTLLMLVAFAVVITLMGTLSYAFFSTIADNSNATQANLKTGTMALRFADNDNGINTQLSIGESVTKKFIVENTGTLESSMSMDWTNMVNTYLNGSLTYRLEYSAEEDGEYETIIDTSNIPVSHEPLTQPLATEISVPANGTYYYNLVITYEVLPDVNQEVEMDSIFTTNFEVAEPVQYRYYRLSVDPNGGEWETFTGVQEYLMQNNDTMEIPDPTKIGSTFNGWEMIGAASELNGTQFTMGIANTTLKASWNAIPYRITIDAQGGEYKGETSFDTIYGNTLTLETPTREGYTFNGWTVSGGRIEGNTFTLTETKNVTITANWTVNTYDYEIQYRQMNLDGESYTVVDSEKGSLEYGAELSPNPKEYAGFTTPDKKSITIGIDATKNVIIYDYVRNKYTVTINPNGGSYSGDTTKSMYYGETLELSTPTKEGYTFTGWQVSGGTIDEENKFTLSDASNITITAGFTINSYKYEVRHRQMNVSGEGYTVVDTETGTLEYGKTLDIAPKTYAGFTTPSAQTITIGVDESKNIITYDYERIMYVLSIDPNGGTYEGKTTKVTKDLYYGATLDLSAPTKEGYSFTGWTVSSGSIDDENKFTLSDASNVTITANWSINKYNYEIQYRQMNLDGESYTVVDSEKGSLDYGTVVSPTPIEYAGFTTPDKKSITIGVEETQNVIVYDYVRNKYTVTINTNGGSYSGDTTVSMYYGATLSLSSIAREGYTFTGWQVSGGTIDEENKFTLTDASNVTITAGFTVNSYKYEVRHRQMNVNGEGYTVVDTETGTLEYGKTLDIAPKTYAGFTTPSAQTITIGVDESKNIITYDYERIMYVLSINPNGGTYEGKTTIATKDLYYGATLELSTPVREGYTFNGWEVTGGKIEDNKFTMSDATNSVIKATWLINSYSYTVNHYQMKVTGSDYELKEKETKTIEYGTKVTPAVKTYEGFTAPTTESITVGVGENKVDYYYTRNQHTLTIAPAGGTYSGSTSQKLYYGATATISNPTKEGNTFAGWTVSSGSLSGTTFTMGDSDATLTAKWTANDYDYIVYHKQMNIAGTAYDILADTVDGEAAFGTTVSPDVNTYTGFTSPSKTSLTIKVDTNTPPTLNVVNYNYTRNKYTLTINPNGGTYNSTTSNSTVSMYYKASTTLSTPTRTGYTFTGWTNSGGTLSSSTFTMSDAKASSVTAGWSINQYSYTVNHYQMDTDGKTYTLIDSNTINNVNYGTVVEPEVNTYTGFTAPSTQTVTINKADIVIEYKYARNQYTLTIAPNGGTYGGKTENSTLQVYYGAATTLSTPTRTGYTFTGWTKTSGTTGTLNGSTFTMGAGAATVTANWSINQYSYTVNHYKMDTNGEYNTTPDASETIENVNYGTVVEPKVNTYTGFTAPSTQTVTINKEGIVIEYKYTRNQYTLTVNANGGTYSGSTSQSLYYGETATISNPTRDGYTFGGWTVSGGSLSGTTFTMGNANATLTAKWTVNQYAYTVNHYQMNVSGSGYTKVSADTVSSTADYGTTIPTTQKTYTGFTYKETTYATGGNGTVTTDTTKNVVNLYYSRNQYTLTIAPNGGTYNSTTSNSTVSMYYKASTTLSTPTRTGYTFTGWTNSGGTLSGSTFTMSDAKASSVTAGWSVNSYNYTVNHYQMNTDGSTYTLKDTETLSANYGTSVTPAVKTTYTGFTAPSTKSITIVVDTSTPSKNIVNYYYTRNQYTLTIAPNGGTYNSTTSNSTVKVYYGASTTLATPTRTGYTFSSWSKTSGTTGTLNGSTFTMGAGNATVTAGWTINSYAYTVNHYQLNVSGSGYTLESTQNLSANYGTTQTPAVKTYTGFTSPSTSSVTIGVDTTKNVVNYYYTRNQYTLTINANGGTSSVSSGDRYYGASVSLGTPTRTGYTFSSWTKTTGAGSVSGTTFTMGAGAATVQANWTANEYAVTFNANGGTVEKQSKTVTYASTYGELPTPEHPVTGYTFNGWYTEYNGGTQVTSDTKVQITADQTLYAHWTIPTFNVVQAVNAIQSGAIPDGVNTGTPDFATIEQTDEGVYAMEDNYGTSYYYRGAVTNNYVKFAGFYWRVIRVNGDGSVRMIYDGTSAHTLLEQSADRVILTGTQWNASHTDAKYVGYMYGGANAVASTSKEGAQTNETSSNAKTQLEAWYKTNIEDTGYSGYLADVIFCNDRSTASTANTWYTSDTTLGYGKNNTFYGAYARFRSSTLGTDVNPTPTFVCPTNTTVNSTGNNDWFTVDATSENKGNGALDYPVGMITADEIVTAGGKLSTSSGYYLYKGYWYWSFSPSNMLDGFAVMHIVNADGSLSVTGVQNGTGGIAPVINLSAETAKTLIGKGTIGNEYRLS